jgi:sugar phosphate isomerase/epimerase
MSLDELLEFSAEVDFDAVDLTAYYFPGYPTPPSDEYIFHIKRRALHLGLDISGTGVRTDFTAPDPEQRDANLPYIEEWLQAAQKLGAPTLRIFAGHETPAGYSRAQVTQWVVEGIKKSVTLAAKYGIVLTLQNHNNFIKTPDQLFEILREVDSEWLAVHLDIGSFRSKDPYSDIARVAPYACNWQIKENVYFEDKQVGTDLGKIVEILRDARYRGYILLETLGEGDPKIKVPRFMEELREAVSDL